jgi:ankyrin repeat protein
MKLLTEIWAAIAPYLPDNGLVLRTIDTSLKRTFSTLPLPLHDVSLACRLALVSSPDLVTFLQNDEDPFTSSLKVPVVVDYLLRFPQRDIVQVLQTMEELPGYSCLRCNALRPLTTAIEVGAVHLVAFLAKAHRPASACRPFVKNPLYVAVEHGADVMRALVENCDQKYLKTLRWKNVYTGDSTDNPLDQLYGPYARETDGVYEIDETDQYHPMTFALFLGDTDVVKELRPIYADLPDSSRAWVAYRRPPPYHMIYALAKGEERFIDCQELTGLEKILLMSFACMVGNVALVKALAEELAGIKIHEVVMDSDMYDVSYLRVAALSGHTKVINFLLKAGHTTTSFTLNRYAGLSGDVNLLKLLHAHNELRFPEKAITGACEGGHAEAFHYLKKFIGRPLVDVRGEGSSLLLRAVATRGHEELAAILVDGGCPVTHRVMIDAVMGGHFSTVELLLTRFLEAGEDINRIPLGLGNSILHCAVYENRADMVSLLLKHGADPLVRNKSASECTCIESAQHEGREEVLALLTRIS